MRAEIIKKISENKNPSKVNLANMAITNEEIPEIVIKIRHLKPNMAKIDLDNNQIGDEGAESLSKHLADFPKLNQLSIQFNDIGRKGAMDLFSLKRENPNLDILFRGNKITDVIELKEIEDLALQQNNYCP